MKSKRTIHVLMTVDAVGGTWPYAMLLVKSLQPYGTRFTVVTMGAPLSNEQVEEASRLYNLTVIESTFKTEWMQNPWREVDEAGQLLLEVERKMKPDLVHLNGYTHAALPFLCPILIAGHSCVFSWWKATYGQLPPEEYTEYYRRVKKGLESADVVTAPSMSMLQDLNHLYGRFSKQLVISDSCDVNIFHRGIKEDYIFCGWPFKKEEKYISVMKEVAGELVWPIAYGHEYQPETSLENKQATDHVFNQSRFADQLSRASIYLLPALYEPSGRPVLEAAFSGCALILGDIPSLRENWEGAALFANPDSADEIQELINFLICNPNLREEMCNRAFERAKRFLPEKKGNAYNKLYNNMLKSPVKNRTNSFENSKPYIIA